MKRKLLKDEKPFMRLAGIMKGLPSDLSQRKGYSRTPISKKQSPKLTTSK
jgi:hypothetical protein